MAERRMFAKSIVLTDAFLDMPTSARCLYFTLGMLADDDGFVGSPKSIMRQCGASEDDMRVLLAKRFVLGFESGVIVIKHWRMNNYLQNDRHKQTTYLDELATLTISPNGAYTEADKECIQVGYTDKNSIDKNSKDKNIYRQKFTPPTIDEVKAYCDERQNGVDYQKFYEYYSIANWKDSKGNPVKNWKQKMIANWEKDKPVSKTELPTYTTDKNVRLSDAQMQELLELRKEQK